MRALVNEEVQTDSFLLVWLSTFFMAAMSLSGSFINIYIFRIDRSLAAIGQFNLFVYMAFPLAFYTCGKLSAKMAEIWFIRGGVLLLIGFYVWLLGQGSAPKVDLPLLGLLYGFGQGVYWYGFNLLGFDSTSWKNRHSFQGKLGLSSGLATTISPLLAGVVIAMMAGYKGYYAIFIVSLMLFIALLFATLKATKRSPSACGPLREGFRFRADPDWMRLWIGTVAFGLREGVYAFFISLLVYAMTKSEEYFGLFSLLMGITAILGYYGAGKLKTVQISLKTVQAIAAVVLAGAALLWLIGINFTILWIFGTLTAVSLPFFMVSYQTILLNEIEETKHSQQHRAAYLISREMALAIGRLMGVGGLWLIARNDGVIAGVPVFGVLGASILVTVLMMRKVEFNNKNVPPIAETSGDRAS